jgi:hypothetical protein
MERGKRERDKDMGEREKKTRNKHEDCFYLPLLIFKPLLP